jgi:ubiquinone/menaquinone biosynthesis C-methylase UbiE
MKNVILTGGTGYFSIPIEKMVGQNGKVIASDLQQGMLDKMARKIENTELKGRIILHKNEQDKIGVGEKADFILVFYMMHEVPDHRSFLG